MADDADATPALPFVVLCDFLAGVSLEDLRFELRASGVQVEELLRAALLAYGFSSFGAERSRRREPPLLRDENRLHDDHGGRPV